MCVYGMKRKINYVICEIQDNEDINFENYLNLGERGRGG